MSRLPPSFIDELKARLPLSSVIGRHLQWDGHKSQARKGEFWACCPFHGEKTASFHVSDKAAAYHCFGCKASGDAVAFLVERKGYSFLEAVRELARLAGIAMPAADPEEERREASRATLLACLAAAQAWFAERLRDPKGVPVGRAFVSTRNIGDDEVERFGLGLAPAAGGVRAALKPNFSDEIMIEAGLLKRRDDGSIAERFKHRLMFPVRDGHGRTVGFGGRDISGDTNRPKYLNSPETPVFHKGSLLYGADLAFDPAREQGRVALVEGYIDVIACMRAGLPAVAPMGTALTETQLLQLWRLAPEPVILLDGDKAGQAAASRLIDTALPLIEPGRTLRFVTLDEGKDPDEYLNSHGAPALSQAADGGVGLAYRLWDKLTAEARTDTPEARAALTEAVTGAVGQIKHEGARKAYEAEFGERLRSFWKDKGQKAAPPKFKRPKRERETGAGATFGDGDLERMNRDYALVIFGQKALILRDGAVDRQHSLQGFEFLSIDAFHIWMRNRIVWHEGKRQSLATIWLEHRQRRQYRGIEFTPGAPGEAVDRDGYYNFWRGYAVEPKRNDELVKPWLDHIHEVIAAGNEEHARWIVMWFAAKIQKPRTRYGTTLVLRGGEGSGKTLAGQIFGQLFPASYFLVDQPHYLVGQFNAHLARCNFLQIDEGFWAGDKQAEGRLKGLITSDHQMIEPKGVDAVKLANYVTVMMSSNEDWVVPAGPDARRYAVFDVSSHRARDHAYFSRLVAAYQSPEAKAALLDYLMRVDLDDAALRRAPATDALLSQKIRSFDAEQNFVFDILQEGRIGDMESWPRWIGCGLFHNAYLKRCEKYGARHPKGPHAFGRIVARYLPGALRKRKLDGQRWISVYAFSSLEVMRMDFEQAIGQPVTWNEALEELDLHELHDSPL